MGTNMGRVKERGGVQCQRERKNLSDRCWCCYSLHPFLPTGRVLSFVCIVFLSKRLNGLKAIDLKKGPIRHIQCTNSGGGLTQKLPAYAEQVTARPTLHRAFVCGAVCIVYFVSLLN
jgi:hypothetical protein